MLKYICSFFILISLITNYYSFAKSDKIKHRIEKREGKGNNTKLNVDLRQINPQPEGNRSKRIHIATKDEDPFASSLEWSLFVKRMDNISELVKFRLKNLINTINELNLENSGGSNEEENPKMLEFASNFKNEFDIFVSIFQPLQEHLDLNKAYTIFDPAVGLETLEKCFELAKSDPTNVVDKGRLKWIEINAMASTLHHIFNRLTPEFENYGLGEIADVLSISHPSWTASSFIKESGYFYEEMKPSEMIDYIHKEMTSLGKGNHLIRLLEGLLTNQLGLKGWDPSTTNLNKYCFGNNQYGLIHDKFDVIIDAAMYLVLSDMKYAIVQMIHNIHQSVNGGNTGLEKSLNLNEILNQTMLNMNQRIAKKIKFTKLVEKADVTVVSGPQVFRCDPAPVESCPEGDPHVTAANCPKGVYLIRHKVFSDGDELTVPKDLKTKVLDKDGKPIACIGLEQVALNKDTNEILQCRIIDEKCVDSNGTEIEEPPYKIETIPVLIDNNRVPYHRDQLIEMYSEGSQWGKFDCIKDPDHPPSPPGGPGFPSIGNTKTGRTIGTTEEVTTLPPASLECDIGPNDKGLGYIDCRPPGLNKFNTAEFAQAFPGYIESELVLHPDGKCVGTCQEYNNPITTCTNKTTHCDFYRKSHCEIKENNCMKRSACPHKAKRCIGTSKQIKFCPGAPGSGHLYDWYLMNETLHKVLGVSDLDGSEIDLDIDLDECEGGNVSTVNERWEMEEGVILNTPQYCELCMCICSDPIIPEGRHYFNVAPIMANTAENFVIVGLRFQKKENVVFLNIQEGKLLENGKVETSTLKWLDGPEDPPKLVQLGRHGFDKINLDIIEPTKRSDMLTGLKWKITNAKALSLEGGFNTYDNGKLDNGPPVFHEAKFPIPKAKRDKIDLTDTVTPLKQTGPSQPYPYTDNSKYIEFDATSLEKDGGQAVAPFFDLQALSSPDGIPRPLRNIGLLYKSKKGSGGFITTITKF